MSFFNFDKIFLKDSQGRKVFYPLIFLGSGFVVETKEQEEQIKNLYKKSFIINIVWCILLLIGTLIQNLPTILFLLLIFGSPFIILGWFLVASRKITKDLSKSQDRPTLLGWIRIFAKNSPWFSLIIIEGFLVYMLIGMIKVMIAERYSLPGEIIRLLFFSFIFFWAGIAGYMIFYKAAKK